MSIDPSSYTFNNVAEAVGGKVLLLSEPSVVVKYLLTDSRKVTDAPLSVFFAIKTEKNNGIKYIPELVKSGVKNFIVQDESVLDFIPPGEAANINLLLVGNVVAALQVLAAFHRKKFNIPVVGITGSNGKTIVKEWIYQMLYRDKQVIRSPKSYNSQTGVPLSVWQLHADADIAIFEAGISQPGEMEKLEAIISPTIGIFTNIGDAHQSNFSSYEEKVREKLQLFRGCDVFIYCKDHGLIDEVLQQNALFAARKLMSWGRNQDSLVRITEIKTEVNSSRVEVEYAGKCFSILIPFKDQASLENALHGICLLLHLGYDEAAISERVITLTPVEMRLEQKEGSNNCILVNDSYNSDPVSLEIALDFLMQQGQGLKKTIILSDIQQSGLGKDQLYEKVSSLLTNKNISRVIGIGPDLQQYRQLFENAVFYPSTEEFLQHLRQSDFQDEAILIKGARVFEFEKISERLQLKLHKTTLEVNLSAMAHNLGVYRSLIRPGTRIMAMVKAFSYGSGSYEVASLLQFHKVDYLAVAYADEGVELRQKGISLPIMVMNPEPATFGQMIRYKLEPEIYSFRIMHEFSEALKQQPSELYPYPVHVKIDTGMHRLGFLPAEVTPLAEYLQQQKLMKVQSAFTHLAASDDEKHDAFTLQQVQQFEQARHELQQLLSYPFLKHILNTGGIVRFPGKQMDLVRLGIGLYGVDTTGKLKGKLRQVNTLKTMISQIKNVEKGETVGYSRGGVAEEDTRIATIGIGYADGMSRGLGNGKGQVLVNGRLAPVIGNVCMDMCMVNITGIPAVEGDTVIIFGEDHPVEHMAVKSGTIPYEVLTGISQRVKRVYFQE